jgi:hypothetical protein
MDVSSFLASSHRRSSGPFFRVQVTGVLRPRLVALRVTGTCPAQQTVVR